MTSERTDELRGVLFPNDRKRPDKQDPDFKGHVQIQGVKYWISAWKGTSAKGGHYVSLKLSEDGAKSDAPKIDDYAQRRNPPPPFGGDLDDEIPF